MQLETARQEVFEYNEKSETMDETQTNKAVPSPRRARGGPVEDQGSGQLGMRPGTTESPTSPPQALPRARVSATLPSPFFLFFFLSLFVSLVLGFQQLVKTLPLLQNGTTS